MQEGVSQRINNLNEACKKLIIITLELNITRNNWFIVAAKQVCKWSWITLVVEAKKLPALLGRQSLIPIVSL